MRRRLGLVGLLVVLVGAVVASTLASWGVTVTAPPVPVTAGAAPDIRLVDLASGQADQITLTTAQASAADPALRLSVDGVAQAALYDQAVAAGVAGGQAHADWAHPFAVEGTTTGLVGFRYRIARTSGGPFGAGLVLFPVADVAGCTVGAAPLTPDDPVGDQPGTDTTYDPQGKTARQVYCLVARADLDRYENTATATVDRFGTDADPQESASWHSLVVPQPAIEFTIETFITS